MNKFKKAVIYLIFIVACICTGCESVECPLNNTVSSKYSFYAVKNGVPVQVELLDTLTITAGGTDSVLINRMVKASSVDLPVSYASQTDTLVFLFCDTLNNVRKDTIWIDKENHPHYESPSCPAAMFHFVTNVKCTNMVIDSVSIVNPNINYNTGENFKIYFRSSDN